VVVTSAAQPLRVKKVPQSMASPTSSCAQTCSTMTSAPLERVKDVSCITNVPQTQMSIKSTCDCIEASTHSTSQ
jgi:hypothetical protein